MNCTRDLSASQTIAFLGFFAVCYGYLWLMLWLDKPKSEIILPEGIDIES